MASLSNYHIISRVYHFLLTINSISIHLFSVLIMKRFLINISAVIGLLWIINACLDWSLTKQMHHSKERRFVGWNDIIYDSINADLLIMGSSRAWVQYNPEILDSILNINTYNLGIDGSQLNRQIVKYNVYKHYQLRKPQYIIVNTDYVSTFRWSYGYEQEQFYPYIFDEYLYKQFSAIEQFSIAQRYLPLYRYLENNNLATMWKVSMLNEHLYKGYKGQNWEWDGTEFAKIDTLHFIQDDRTIRMFENFLDESKQEGIKIIFCCSPIYIGATKKVDNLQDFYNTISSYSEKYDIPILDYTYSELSYDTCYFYNATHLNIYGAEWFSTQLAHDLDSLQVLH